MRKLGKVARQIYETRLDWWRMQQLMEVGREGGMSEHYLARRFHETNWGRVVVETMEWARSGGAVAAVINHYDQFEHDVFVEVFGARHGRGVAERWWRSVPPDPPEEFPRRDD